MTKECLSQECKIGITFEINIVTDWKRKNKTDDLLKQMQKKI